MRPILGKRRTEQLDYIHSMLRQLRGMAEAERCEMLAYLIGMAISEAGEVMRSERPLRIGEDNRHSAT